MKNLFLILFLAATVLSVSSCKKDSESGTSDSANQYTFGGTKYPITGSIFQNTGSFVMYAGIAKIDAGGLTGNTVRIAFKELVKSTKTYKVVLSTDPSALAADEVSISIGTSDEKEHLSITEGKSLVATVSSGKITFACPEITVRYYPAGSSTGMDKKFSCNFITDLVEK